MVVKKVFSLILLFFTARNCKLLALLFAKAKKVTKISLRLHFSATCSVLKTKLKITRIINNA